MDRLEPPFIHIDEDSVIIEVDKRFYEKQVILKAAYVFTDSGFVLFKENSQFLMARLFLSEEAKKVGKTLLDLAEEFTQELIEQSMRVQVIRETGDIRDTIVRRAFQSGGIKINS